MIDIEYFQNNFFGYEKKVLPFVLTEKKFLKSCDRCQGTGRVSETELTDYHRREYDTFYSDCKRCSGQGRVIVTSIFVDVGDIPYDMKKKAIDFRSILFETYEEPYTAEGAKDIETYHKKETFYIKFEDIKTYGEIN